MLTPTEKSKLIKKYSTSKVDTGSPEVQIAIFTAKINLLTEHLNIHKKDNHTRKGLLGLVSKRRKLLDYLKKNNTESYESLIKSLSIRK